MLAFSVWIPAACIVWLAAFLMLFSARTRHLAGPLALAMAATFPGVLLFQIVTIPAVIVTEGGAYLFWRLLEPTMPDTTHNPAVFADFVLTGLLTFGLMLAMSIAGFLEGWRVGWWCAQGRTVGETVKRGPTAHLIGLARGQSRGQGR
jgi:hypothetical protein